MINESYFDGHIAINGGRTTGSSCGGDDDESIIRLDAKDNEHEIGKRYFFGLVTSQKKFIRFIICLEIIGTIIDLTEFILKIAYCNTLYWYDESKLLVYHFSYIISFNTISIALMICVYYKYLQLKKNEELDSMSL